MKMSECKAAGIRGKLDLPFRQELGGLRLVHWFCCTRAEVPAELQYQLLPCRKHSSMNTKGSQIREKIIVDMLSKLKVYRFRGMQNTFDRRASL